MDDMVYEKNLRVYQSARAAAVLTGAITAFITFAAFMIAGFGIQETAAWMFALSLMSASVLFVVIHIVSANHIKRRQPTPPA